MDSLSITKKLAKEICNKEIRISKDKSFYQDCQFIFMNNWCEGLHEIAHYMVSDPNECNKENLGLPTSEEFYSGRYDESQLDRLLFEEASACILTKLLFKKKYEKIATYSKKEYDYINYLGDYTDRIGESSVDIEKANIHAENMLRVFTE